ncbi:hypothetical protein ACQP0C_24440 [Nocardia sp. CA-129566]|uniref:hypothetical protein n=1 Tax=Nocardia sp. CA-129566 TaxID=3239976 RepID=UPI003D97F86E
MRTGRELDPAVPQAISVLGGCPGCVLRIRTQGSAARRIEDGVLAGCGHAAPQWGPFF